ncbi:MAG: TonB family protein [Phycisphaerales bacterium]
MRLGLILGIALALLLHAAVILFGGLIFHVPKEGEGQIHEVELVGDVDENAQKPKDEPPPPEEKIEQIDKDQPPDPSLLAKQLDAPAAPNDAPALEAASLSAIEAALSGQSAGGGDFGQALSFTSGGRIGGTGKAGAVEEKLEEAFSLAEIDQKPRAVFQSAPVYPTEMRGKKIEGVVTVIFVVDPTGKVANVRVEKSNNPAFEAPAISAVKKWKFEPGVRAGQRVPCKMRIPIRFPPIQS